MAQLMLLPLAVSCFSKIHIGFTFLVPAHLVVPEKGPLNGCVCVYFLAGNEIENASFLMLASLIPLYSQKMGSSQQI